MFSDGWKDLKNLFYDIQQIGYYCDFTLESAQESFDKISQFDTAKIIKDERKVVKEM